MNSNLPKKRFRPIFDQPHDMRVFQCTVKHKIERMIVDAGNTINGVKKITLKNFKKYLQSFPHFTLSAWETALPFLKTINLQKGEFLLEEGKICRQVAFIEDGLFRTYYLRDGEEITTCFCKENTITCSYKSLITQSPSELSIQAIEDCELIAFQYEDLQKLYAKDLFWQQVGRLAAENEFMIMEHYTRFINDLPAQDRYQQILKNDPSLLNRIPLVYLASYLQIKPETLSRIRKKLATS